MSAFGGKADMKIVTAPSANPGIVREEQAMADFKMRWAASIS